MRHCGAATNGWRQQFWKESRHVKRRNPPRVEQACSYPVTNTLLIRKASVYMVSSRNTPRLFAAAAVAAVAVLTMSFGPSDSPLVFVDEEPLTVTWEQVKTGEEVVVCNLGQDRLRNVRAKFMGFNIPANNGDPLQPPEGTSFQDKLMPSKCTNVRIKAKEGAELSPAEYEGGLVVSAAGVERITRNVVIQVPKPTVKGVVDNTVLTSRLWGGPFSTKSTDNFRLDLKLEGEGNLPSDLELAPIGE